MINEFISQTTEFLNQSNIRIHESDVRLVEINDDCSTIRNFSYVNLNPNDIAENVLLHPLLFFTLLDANLDLKYPELSGKSFSHRYRNLPSSNDQEIILKECYRILKLLRNASAHNKNSISYNDEFVCVSYQFGGKDYKLKIKKYGLELIYSCLLKIYLDFDKMLPNEYRTGLARTYYDDILENISLFSDDEDTNLMSISQENLRIKRNVRYRIKKPEIEELNELNGLRIITTYASNEEIMARDEFLIEYKNKAYLVPAEVLDNDNKIQISELKKWVYSGE
ncbi:hypothetical protein [Shouchella clausii]|uniref:hypothetical protein n=1 Tax=Shouchella clausii TaxID=79880 RepID=UPI000B96ABF8|nr:hypothetical protein [Shouchella clausii]AST97677.1 hypothetical protein BC8716_17630 [Shouchella clausii]MCR1290100.1 hypothetical protein [Shouchella clausii]MEB5475224.1 hypothetical protein [Shouchella clausii]PAD93977.1 hypothetical protein CHH52_01835 [Shouchella clausii]QNM44116.1 hypothetical protein DUT88_14940 [Shouchella clausii]